MLLLRHGVKLNLMSQALYRKWRPTRFDQVVGQEHVTQTLRNAGAGGRIGHAYLFSGPRGTGKTTVARLLAKAANCLHEDLRERPCDVCAPCVALREGRYLDLIEIDAASNTGVDDIRDLRDKINFAPSEGRFKVYIIDEVHMLSTAAFNALLKTLEEPPAHAIFVLATTEEHKVPLTVKSRCQQFSFRLLTTKEIMGRLAWLTEQEQLSIEPQATLMIAQQGAGSVRDAESLLDQLMGAPGDGITLEHAQMILGTASSAAVAALTDAMIAGDSADGLEIIHEALSSGADPRQFARQMLAYLRQILLLKMAGPDLALEVSPEQKDEMNRRATAAERAMLTKAVKRFDEATRTSAGNWQPQLPLELAFIECLEESAKRGPTRTETVEEEVYETESEPIAASSDLEEQKPTLTESAPAQPAAAEGADVLSLDLVTANWPRLRERVGKKNRNLTALLASCKPLATEGNVLILGFDFPILKEKFDGKQQTADTVAGVLSDLLGIECIVKSVVSDQYEPVPQLTTIDKDDFAALAEELGGVIHDAE